MDDKLSCTKNRRLDIQDNHQLLSHRLKGDHLLLRCMIRVERMFEPTPPLFVSMVMS